ncbi:MAG TPA: methyltransferase domain-containing protein [Dehalococcoidia bacterium]|nr:methyltransferase domain-containing protein [Dehalococcoidia bacterium]
MKASLQRRIQRYGWDKAVDDYSRYWVPLLEWCSERCVELVDPQPGQQVLDIAAGPGTAALKIAELVKPEGRVVASDISEEMAAEAMRRAKEVDLDNVEARRAAAEELPFADNSFDAITCVLGLMYAETQPAVAEIHRVLRPGGGVAVCVWGRRDRCGWSPIFPIVDARVTSEVCPMFFLLGAEGALSYAFANAGFEVLAEERVETTLEFESPEHAWGAVLPGGPAALAYDRFTPEVQAEVRAEYIASIDEYHQGDRYLLPGEFVFLSARK